MARYAFMRNNEVCVISDLDASEYASSIALWDALIDVSDIVPEPAVGWILVGNTLSSEAPLSTVDETTLDQQKNQRVFGQKLSPIVVDKMGARNLKLALEGSSPNVGALLSALGSVKALMETGALKTARGVMVQVRPTFPLYEDILDYAVAEISNFLSNMNYE